MATSPHSRQTKKARILVKKQAEPAVPVREPGEHPASAQDEARIESSPGDELSVQPGCQEGHAVDDWLEVGREIAQP